MKLPPDLKKDFIYISLGVVAGLAITVGIFALVGRFEWRVLFGALLGGACAIGNFFYLARSVQRALNHGERAKHIMQSSYTVRMLLSVAVMILAFVCKDVFHWLPVIIALLLPRLVIFILQLLGVYNPDAMPDAEADKSEGSDAAL